MLHVSLTADPELADTPLPVHHNDSHRVVVDGADVVERRPRRRNRHWKTREWKRRSAIRRLRAQAEIDIAALEL